MTTEPQLAGKTALVTGATRGLGRSLAVQLAAEGAFVYALGRSQADLASLVADIGPKRAQMVVADLSSNELDTVVRDLPPLDILVNSAAAEEMIGGVLEQPQSHWETVFAVNFWAPLRLIQIVAPAMIARGGGSIINISSVAGQRAVPLLCAYSVSKAALDALTRSVGMELGARGIRCNAIACGRLATGKSEGEIFQATADDDGSLADIVPAGRAGSPAEVGNLVVWLASEASTYVNGAVVPLDGGVLAGGWEAIARLRSKG